ncbi:MAG: hypothetical protein ABII22_04695 [Candidatus Micrarchaeota archaeon]
MIVLLLEIVAVMVGLFLFIKIVEFVLNLVKVLISLGAVLLAIYIIAQLVQIM